MELPSMREAHTLGDDRRDLVQVRLGQPEDQDGDGKHQPGDRPGNADIEQDTPVAGRLLDVDKSTQRAQQGHWERDEIGQGDTHFMVTADQVMAKFMRTQDGQQADGKRQPADQPDSEYPGTNGS